MSEPQLLALVGPTASGKSEIALKTARKLGASILSCDSLLVYRDLNVGTAKPSQAEMDEIPHFGINLVGPEESYTAGDYVRYARPILEDHVQRGQPLLIVGGTGFYLKALLCGVWDAPPTQPAIRARLESEVAKLSEEERGPVLHRKLVAVDPEYAPKIKPQDVYRVLRALEIIEVTGEPLSVSLQKRQRKDALPYDVPVFGIRRSRQDLEKRIFERTNQMFSHGIVNEVRALLEKHPEIPRSMHCVGYWEVLQHLKPELKGEMSLAQCRERVLISTRQLAKKQMTFFKTFPIPIAWHSLPAEEEKLLSALLAMK